MKTVFAALAAVAVCALAGSAMAANENLVVNGSFEETTNGGGQVGFDTDLTGWTLSAAPGYTFVFPSGSADTTGVTGQYGNLQLWGPNNGSANGLPANSPDGGNFVGEDAEFQVALLQQTITGLTPGTSYNLDFYSAFGQQYTFDGPTLQSLTVSLGDQSFNTATVDVPSHGFTGWKFQNLIFTATSASETLSFLANANYQLPPFALIDGVSLSAVPEPADWALMLIGVAGLGGVARVRRRRALAAV